MKHTESHWYVTDGHASGIERVQHLPSFIAARMMSREWSICFSCSEMSGNFSWGEKYNIIELIIRLKKGSFQIPNPQTQIRGGGGGGATIHIPLPKFATLNKLKHCSPWEFSGALFLISQGAFLHFGGETWSPYVFFSILIPLIHLYNK